MRGWDYGDKTSKLKKYDKVIVVGISFLKEEMDKLYNRLLTNFVWIDNHISAIKENDIELITGIQNIDFGTCELTWQYFFPKEKIPEIVRLLGRYDNIINQPEIKEPDEWQKILEFQYVAKIYMNNYNNSYERLISWEDNYLYYILEQGNTVYKHLYTSRTNLCKRTSY